MASDDFTDEVDPSGRITPIRAADMRLPAQCFICGRGSYNVDEAFLDIKREIYDFGSIYFCMECAQEIGYAGGCARKRDFKAALEDNARLKAENEKYETMAERLGDGLERDILDWLERRGINVPVNATHGVSSSDDDSADATVDGLDKVNVGTTSSTVAGTVDDVADESTDDVESVTIEGPNDADESASVNERTDYEPVIEL